MAGLGWYACTDAVSMTADPVRTVAARRIRRSSGGAKPHNRFLTAGRRELDPCPGAPMLVDMSEQRRPTLEIRVTALEWEVRQLRGELIRAKTAGECPTSPMPPFAPVVEGRLPTAPPPAFSETPGPSLEPRRSPAAQ